MRVGYLFNPKKLDKSGIGTFGEYLKLERNSLFMPLDYNSLENVSVDIVVHKMLDVLQAAKTGDEEAKEKIQTLNVVYS